MSVKLGPSRKRNTFSLKATLKTRGLQARRTVNELHGIEKRRHDLRKTLGEVGGLVTGALVQLHEHVDVARAVLAPGMIVTKKRATQIEKMLEKATAAMTLLTENVGVLVTVITREDTSLKAAEREMREARKNVDVFMSDTLRVVNDIAREVIAVRVNHADDLRENKTKQYGDPYLISSLMRTRTRPLNATAVGIYPRRRGVTTRVPKIVDAPASAKTAANVTIENEA